MDYLNLVLGAALLLFGRSLFWLLVGLSGFLLGVQLGPILLPELSPTLLLLASLVIGVLGALLAILAQRVSLGLAGFFVGALLAVNAVTALGHADLASAAALGGAVAGAVVAVLLTDWAIIVLASLAGASVIAVNAGMSGPITTGLFLALFIIGVAVQHATMARIARNG